MNARAFSFVANLDPTGSNSGSGSGGDSLVANPDPTGSNSGSGSGGDPHVANLDPTGSNSGSAGSGGDSDDSRTTTIIIICIVVPLIIIILVILAIAITCRQKRKGLTEASPLRPHPGPLRPQPGPLISKPGQSTSPPPPNNVYLEMIGTPGGSTAGANATLPGENIYDTPNYPPSEMGDEPDYRKMQRELKERNDGTLYPQTGQGNSGPYTLPDPENEYRDIQEELKGINMGKLYPRASKMK